jgi:hypothetical protein
VYTYLGGFNHMRTFLQELIVSWLIVMEARTSPGSVNLYPLLEVGRGGLKLLLRVTQRQLAHLTKFSRMRAFLLCEITPNGTCTYTNTQAPQKNVLLRARPTNTNQCQTHSRTCSSYACKTHKNT